MSVDPHEKSAFKAMLDKVAAEDDLLLHPAGTTGFEDVSHRLLDVENELDVLVWRFEQLRSSGYDEAGASQIAACADIDLHDACRLVLLGCPPALALRILG